MVKQLLKTFTTFSNILSFLLIMHINILHSWQREEAGQNFSTQIFGLESFHSKLIYTYKAPFSIIVGKNFTSVQSQDLPWILIPLVLIIEPWRLCQDILSGILPQHPLKINLELRNLIQPNPIPRIPIPNALALL